MVFSETPCSRARSRTVAQAARDARPARIFHCRTRPVVSGMMALCSPLKKGTVPVGSVDLSRKYHLLERDSPLFQQPARSRFAIAVRSEERRVGKEGRAWGSSQD